MRMHRDPAFDLREPSFAGFWQTSLVWSQLLHNNRRKDQEAAAAENLKIERCRMKYFIELELSRRQTLFE
jgi:hypothetical protein